MMALSPPIRQTDGSCRSQLAQVDRNVFPDVSFDDESPSDESSDGSYFDDDESSSDESSDGSCFDDADGACLIRQPKTRSISQEELVAEVRDIYTGLATIESKCIEVVQAFKSQDDARFDNEQWQLLIDLHRKLLHEHHDFS